ncbi:CBS domain-containing protein, partial [Pseudomonas viridiflava]|uniref:CBS domain-containing protein n=1 Tax=Pseudomonas viridiflava TaxID=33069 RepID=UPI001F144AED
LVLHGRSSVGTPERDILVSNVITVDTHQTVDTCLGIMSDKRLRHLPVVENGKLIGLLSIGDLVKEAIAKQAELIKQMQAGYARGTVTAQRVDSVARVLADSTLGKPDEKTAQSLLEPIAPGYPASWVTLAQLLY